MKTWRGRPLVTLLLCVAVGAGPPVRADPIRFPPAPTDAAGAAAGFAERAEIVIRANACGRELEYATYRRQQLDENYEKQGEDLSSILIGKIAWLAGSRFAGTPCEYALTVARPRNPDGSFVHPTAEAFATATLGAWLDPATPTGCSLPTSLVNVGEQELAARFRVEPDCLRRQVNEAVRAMVKDAQMGTDGLPCASALNTGNRGDWDVNVRDLVRILYMGTLPRREVLEPATVDHMYEHLLSARGGLSDASYSVLADCDDPAGDELGSPEDFADREYWYNELLEGIGDVFEWLVDFFVQVTGGVLASGAGIVAAPFLVAAGEDPTELILPHVDLRVPETENHRLMIEASKYLTNAKILAELRRIDHDNVDEIEEKQAEVRDWLLRTLREIAIHDFSEYNSRPYSRYSLNAILNLYDFAEDPALRTASQIVLDLSGAKFAAASNRGRRIVPFRRLAENDDRKLYEMVSGADHEVARAVVLAGQTQLLGDGVGSGEAANMIYAAVSSYRWPRPVLEVAVERAGTFEQDVRHASVESYYASPAFTMSLGGIRRPAALEFLGFERSVDRGVAMPTVIIPTTAGLLMTDLFAMNGNGSQHRRTDNLCGWRGFICGVQPAPSAAYSQCTTGTVTSTGPDYFFVNSAACAAGGAGPHFYLAFLRGECDDTFCESGRRYGLMEIVEAPAALAEDDPAFEAFRTERRAAFAAAVPDANGAGTYLNAGGRAIAFVVRDDGSRIVSVDGVPRPEFATRGAVIDAQGDGRVVVRSPWSAAEVVIDYTQWNAPQRSEAP